METPLALCELHAGTSVGGSCIFFLHGGWIFCSLVYCQKCDLVIPMVICLYYILKDCVHRWPQLWKETPWCVVVIIQLGAFAQAALFNGCFYHLYHVCLYLAKPFLSGR